MSSVQKSKLELLFDNMSLNNVQNVRPLLDGAIEEYQSFSTRLTYDQKKNVNLIRAFLGHVERDEWHDARAQLHGAQSAYQLYIGSKPQSQKSDYLKIPSQTAKQSAKIVFPEQEDVPPLDRDKYMFRNDNLFTHPTNNNANGTSTLSYEKSHAGTPLRCGSARSQRVNLWSATSRTRTGNQWALDPSSTALDAVPLAKEHVSPSLTSLTSSCDTDKDGKQRTTGSSSTLHGTGDTEEGQGQNVKVETSRSSVNGDQKSSRSSRASSRSPESVRCHDNQRPCKIADTYLALYREEWKHALDHLTKSAVKEETAVECLLYVLMEAYRLCLDEAKLQVKEFENAALNIISNGQYTYADTSKLGVSGNIKHMKDYRREVSDLAVSRLQQQFLTRTLPIIHRRYGVTDSPPLDAYSRRCVEVSWTLAVQDPVIHLDSNPPLLSKMDTALYKTYKQSGTRVRYLVWPVLRLYKGGSVLCRGIAQGDGSGEPASM